MRHADSEDPKQLPGVRDHDRPITAAGKIAAKDVSLLVLSLSIFKEPLFPTYI